MNDVYSRRLRSVSAGLVSLVAVAHASQAWAQEQCGRAPKEGGTVVCEATEEPYVEVRYEGVNDLGVVIEEGAVVDANLDKGEPGSAVVVMGDGEISLVAEEGTVIRGDIMPAIEVGSTSGSVNVQVDEVYGKGVALAAVAGGDVTITADRVEGQQGINAYSSEGNVTINANEVLGTGTGGVGIYAETFSGDIHVTAGSAVGVGDNQQGIYATSETGDVTVDVGIARAEGTFSQAITAFSYAGDGDVTINAGVVSAEGDYVAGIYAAAYTGDININAEVVAVNTIAGRGILAANDIGNVNLNVNYVSTTGDETRAIDVISFGDVSIISSDTVGTFGNYADAINVMSGKSTTIDTGRIYTYGEGATGIYVVGDSVTIDADIIEAHGNYGSAMNVGATNDVNVTVGTVFTRGTNDDNFAIGLASAMGDVSLTVEESVTADAGRAITTYAQEGGVAITVAEGATVWGGTTAIESASTRGTRVDIAGTVTSQDGPAIAILENGFGVEGPADIRIAATGTLDGRISFVGGNDTLTNAGRFLAGGESQFGAGEDRLVNSGVIALREGAGAITFTGLETLENSGTVSLANGRTGDSLTVSGTLDGAAGSALAVDLDIVNGRSDLIEVGDIAGTNALRLNIVGRGSGLGLDGLRILSSASGDDTGDELTLAPESLNRGFVSFALEYDGQDSWRLDSDLADAAYLGGAMAAGVRDLWHLGTDALSTHLLATRDNDGASGVWMQAVGSDLEAQSSLSHDRGTRDLAWDGSHEGLQLGAEKGFGPWRVGVTAGYGTAKISLGRDENSKFDVLNAGLYAAYASDGWFGGALLRADLVDVESHWSSVGLEDEGNGTTLGVDLDGGYRAELGGLWVEPALRLAWVNVSLPDQEGEHGEIRWEDGSAVTGELGLSMGAAPGWLGIPVTPWLSMALAREFGADDATVFDLRTEEVLVTAEGDRTYGRFGAGLGYSTGPVDLYTEVDGRFGDVEGVSGVVGARFRF